MLPKGVRCEMRRSTKIIKEAEVPGPYIDNIDSPDPKDAELSKPEMPPPFRCGSVKAVRNPEKIAIPKVDIKNAQFITSLSTLVKSRNDNYRR